MPLWEAFMAVTRVFRGVQRAFVVLSAVALLFVISLPAHGQTFAVLYSFSGPPFDGARPIGNLVQDGEGNLYGTTAGGGRFGDSGTAFELDAAGNERPLFFFGRSSGDGTMPMSGLVRDAKGDFYGTTQDGGAFGAGTVFMFNGTGLVFLYSFSGAPQDGAAPIAGVVRDCCGNLYGTTESAGTNNRGTVFRINKSINESVLHNFWGGDGASPAGLLGIGGGIFYGTTMNSGTGAGSSRFGTIYQIDSTGKETVLYRFQGSPDGKFPFDGSPAALIRDSAGDLYGTTYQGGAFGFGTVFKLDTSGAESVLYSFAGGSDGAGPSVLVADSSGNLYGTTCCGGDPECKCGVVYEVDPSGNEIVLHTFSGPDGVGPEGLLIDATGNLYGTTVTGGATYVAGRTPGFGTVFKLIPSEIF
jgi:uncharacterized repeat protein (TIGR03803 family)